MQKFRSDGEYSLSGFKLLLSGFLKEKRKLRNGRYTKYRAGKSEKLLLLSRKITIHILEKG